MSEQQEVVVKPEAPVEMGEEQKVPVSIDNPTTEITEAEEDQNTFDDLEGIEFLLDEIEDQIAPLAL